MAARLRKSHILIFQASKAARLRRSRMYNLARTNAPPTPPSPKNNNVFTPYLDIPKAKRYITNQLHESLRATTTGAPCVTATLIPSIKRFAEVNPLNACPCLVAFRL
jgi:hypothetical protein